MKIFNLSDHLTAYYVSGPLADAHRDWLGLDLALGVWAYALHRGGQAVVFDSLLLPEQGKALRAHLENELSIRKITLINSHWHLDHCGGNAAFADCPIISSTATREFLAANRQAILDGRLWGPPGLAELALPNLSGDAALALFLGGLELQLLPLDIHVPGSLALYLPEERILLAGDMLEDCLPVAHPERVQLYLRQLPRLLDMDIRRICPGHGAPEIIAAGGYDRNLVRANLHYLETLLARYAEPGFADAPLSELLAGWAAAGAMRTHAPYAAIHRRNVCGLVESAK